MSAALDALIRGPLYLPGSTPIYWVSGGVSSDLVVVDELKS